MPKGHKQGPQLAPSPPDQAAEAASSVTSKAVDELADRATASSADLELAAAQRRMPARGAPAPLTQSDVDALIQGRIDRTLAEKIASRPLESFERPPSGAEATFAPVRLEMEDLALVQAEGRVSRKFEERIERASLTRGQAVQGEATTSAGKSAPKLSPEEAGEANGP
jgi:hypothetical protein